MEEYVPNTDTQEIVGNRNPAPSYASPSKMEFIRIVASFGTLKWVHESASLNSYKEIPPYHNDILHISVVTLPAGGWVELKKKKGKKNYFRHIAPTDSLMQGLPEGITFDSVVQLG